MRTLALVAAIAFVLTCSDLFTFNEPSHEPDRIQIVTTYQDGHTLIEDHPRPALAYTPRLPVELTMPLRELQRKHPNHFRQYKQGE